MLYCIAEKNLAYSDIKYFDTDLSHMIKERNKRIDQVKSRLNLAVLKSLKTLAVDLEEACLNKRKLKDIFPDCKKPVFIIEGVIYFLSVNCVNWLIEEMASYDQVAVLMDYWPENMQSISQKFREAFKDINQFIPEQTKSFWDDATMGKFKSLFSSVDDWAIADVEEKLLAQSGLSPELLNFNHYFPLKMVTAQKGRMVAGKFSKV